jgi:hypothetical protein
VREWCRFGNKKLYVKGNYTDGINLQDLEGLPVDL